jgi:hypothetical protein
LSQAIRSRYTRRIPQYSSHIRTSGKTRYSNGTSVLAKKIIIQATACIIIVVLCILCLNSTEELPQKIISEIRTRVVERNITPEDMARFFTETYQECVRYIQGNGG